MFVLFSTLRAFGPLLYFCLIAFVFVLGFWLVLIVVYCLSLCLFALWYVDCLLHLLIFCLCFWLFVCAVVCCVFKLMLMCVWLFVFVLFACFWLRFLCLRACFWLFLCIFDVVHLEQNLENMENMVHKLEKTINQNK